MLLPYFGYIAKFTKFTRGSCLPSWEKSKAEESPCKKKKKERKSRPKGERKSTILSRKEKNPVWKWPVQASGAPRWRPDFEQKKSPSNQNLPYMMLKTRFPFLYASTSLDTKTLTIALNFNFESYTTIRCLAPQHVLRFFHFWRGFFLSLWNFAHYCVFLLNAPLSDRDEKKKHLCSGLLLPGNLDPSSLSPGGPLSYWFAILGGEIISWRGASCLRTFVS